MNLIFVPVLPLSIFSSGVDSSSVFLTPSENDILYILLSLNTVTSKSSDKAFTAEAPTPCSPPETWYAPSSNLPPACNVVNTVSTVETFVASCCSTGIPLPLSEISTY